MDIECFTTARWLTSGGPQVITLIACFQGLPCLEEGVVGGGGGSHTEWPGSHLISTGKLLGAFQEEAHGIGCRCQGGLQ